MEKRRNKIILVILILALILAAVLGALLYIISAYKIKTVYVEGNIHYTDEEIRNIVMAGSLGNNSVFLSLKYSKKGIEDIPFVQTMDVNILSPDTVRIMVYEKSLAGYVEYLGRYMYFDKDGIVVENSEVKTAGIPQVTGLSFNYVIMYQPLPVEDKKVFGTILEMTKLMSKYELSADRIYFTPDYEMTVYFGEARVAIGTGDNIDEKMMMIQSVKEELEGKKGVLHLENYNEDTKNVTFEPD